MARGPWCSRLLALAAVAVLVAQAGYVSPILAADPVPAPSESVDPAPVVAATGAAPSPTPTPVPTPVTEPGPSEPDASPEPTPAPATVPPADNTQLAMPDDATELVALRSETSRTFDLGNGLRSTELFTNPVFYDDGSGTMVPIELGFSLQAGTGRADSSRAPVTVEVGPAADAAGALALRTLESTIALRSLGTDRTAVTATAAFATAGRRADVAGVFPGVDLRVFAEPYGASTFLVLSKPPASSAWTFAIDAPGLTASLAVSGAVELRDASGTLAAYLAKPYAMDSTPDEYTGGGRITTAVHYTLGSAGKGQTVTVSLDDAAWLASAVFPVYVDPSMTIYNPGTQSYGDTFINKGNPDMNYGNYLRPDTGVYELWLGQSPSPTTDVARALFKFSLADVSGQSIDSATFKVYPYHQYYNSPHQQDAYLRRVTSDWDEHGSTTGVTWATRPSYTTSGTVTEGCVEGSACAFDVTTWAQGWLAGTTSNYGLQLDRNDLDYHDWGRLYSAEESNHPKQRPRLVVSYHGISATGTTPAFSNGVSWSIGSTLAQTRYEVEVSATNFGTPVASSGEVISSANTWRISPALTDLATYWYRVRVSDGGGWSD